MAKRGTLYEVTYNRHGSDVTVYYVATSGNGVAEVKEYFERVFSSPKSIRSLRTVNVLATEQ